MIGKVLIANRGEVALRVIRAAHSLGIATVAVYADPDAASLYVQEADEAVHLDGTTAADTYLVADRLLDAAAASGADAIHPGYGFLSENAGFAAACETAGLIFVGPPAEAIRLMGDKLGAKAIMAAHGVPTLASVTVGDEPDADVANALASVGLPAIIKASAGGGGRGMRIVTEPAEFARALESARREAQAAFGDPTVFIERYLSPARHIEVQVVADRHGGAATLFERECSIQRRHQKLVEESPSPFVDAEMRARLVDAATKAVRAVDYQGVGTVEFVAGPDRSFAFLEMNTRLQVEHPVTELVTGVDLVRLQFKVAAGEPLGDEVTAASLHGHAIEVRLCAEDPEAGYLPASGTFSVFEVGGGDDAIRVDSGVASGSEVSPYYDSMVAKVIAWGETRSEAAARLARSLEGARVHGVITNRDLLVNVLRSAEFLAGDTSTDFLERVPGLTRPRTSPMAQRAHAAVAAIALDRWNTSQRQVQSSIPSGWRNNRSDFEQVELVAGETTYRLECDPSTRHLSISVDGEPLDLVLHAATSERVDATIEGIRRRYRVAVLDGQVLVDSPQGSSAFQVADRFPLQEGAAPAGGLSAPMPGRVVRTLVEVGQPVEAGDPLLVLEAMKMEHTISTAVAGHVTALYVSEGDQVERGAVLAAVEETDAT
jgi:acyl-CoA carboxylase subunit alpha